MPDIRWVRKEEAESLTEKKKILRTKKYYIFFLLIIPWFLCPFCSVVSVLQNVLSFFGNQCITIDDWLIFLMHINAKTRV